MTTDFQIVHILSTTYAGSHFMALHHAGIQKYLAGQGVEFSEIEGLIGRSVPCLATSCGTVEREMTSNTAF